MVGGNPVMCVSSEDIALLAQLVAEEHGSKAEQHINQYIDDLRQTNDEQAVDLWQKVAAFWYAKNRHPLG